MATTAAKVFVVKPVQAVVGEGAKSRLIRAERRTQVESYILGDFIIEPASVDEAHELAKVGIEIEDAE